jgi:cytoskeletal protein CcmA (bactofilin family)
VVEGEVRGPNIILNGAVIGDVYANERVELVAKAKVTGNVYYNLIEMAIGAEVNGNLVHKPESGDSGEIEK